MVLSKQALESLMQQIGLTRESEINCEQCLLAVAEFAELQLAGKSLPEGLSAVEHHLAICGECREEYEVLRRALEGLDS